MLERSEYSGNPWEEWAKNEADFPEVTYASILKQSQVLPLPHSPIYEQEKFKVLNPDDFPDGLSEFVTGIGVYASGLESETRGNTTEPVVRLKVTINKVDTDGQSRIGTYQASLKEGDQFLLRSLGLGSPFDDMPIFKVGNISSHAAVIIPVPANMDQQLANDDTLVFNDSQKDPFDAWGEDNEKLLDSLEDESNLESFSIISKPVKLKITKEGAGETALHAVDITTLPEELGKQLVHMYFYKATISMKKKDIGGIEIDEEEAQINIYFELLPKGAPHDFNRRFRFTGKAGDRVRLDSYTNLENLPLSDTTIFQILEIGENLDYVTIGPEEPYF